MSGGEVRQRAASLSEAMKQEQPFGRSGKKRSSRGSVEAHGFSRGNKV